MEIGLSVDSSQKADKATTYTKTEVDGMIVTKDIRLLLLTLLKQLSVQLLLL
jgi:hypothetical protein